MLSIGEFSKICAVTTKTLRYYDEIGLLKPTIINQSNGYRYYDDSQLETMLLISKLKSYTFSLEEIQDILQDTSEEKLLYMLTQKGYAVRSRLSDLQYIQKRINLDIGNLERGLKIMAYLNDIQIELVERPDVTILYSRQNMSIDDFGKYYGMLFSTALKGKYTICGAPMAIYHDKEFDPQNNDTELAFPVKEQGEGTRILKGGLHTKAVLRGPYSELPSVYARVKQWVDENGYTIAAPPFEAYLNDPCSGISPEEYLTEIYFPVAK